ncbi:BamA/TamA family outer membrane protein [Thiomicrospira sp. R3]|uniref:autotransporter assembly complex protein TamA n=1 Tax=Thiomicrospira sp. R3 TaxID=3035472 RepID=UPI00259BE0D8|nr:BamA/TamA family outer membrane protein [Thiomicrospira sp. R3]WFE68764.1 BamA/TamA family outer membrane protein [Thiomicrospira sp. R3]
MPTANQNKKQRLSAARPHPLLHITLLFLITLIFSASAHANPIKLTIQIDCVDALECDARNALISQLKQDLSIAQLETDEFPAQTDFLFNRVENEIRNALRAQGYYTLQLEKKLDRQAANTLIELDILLDLPVRIRKIDIQILGAGKDLIEWRNYRQFELKLRQGNQLNHSDYTRTLSDLRNIALNQGYLDAEFMRREFRVYPDQAVADIFIHLDTREGYQFGDIRFSKSQKVPQSLLNRYKEIQPGDPFNQQDMTRLQRALIDSRYFGMVRLDPVFEEEQNRQIPINIELEDNMRQAYSAGIGYGTDTGARLLLGFEDRIINRRGHSYQADALYGERAQSFQFNYRLPGPRPIRQEWNIGFSVDATQSDSLERTRTAFTPSFIFKLDDTWQLNLFSSLEKESFQYSQQPKEANQLLLIGAGIQKRWVNNQAYPTLGYRHNATLRLSAENTLSESEFIQFEWSSRGIYAPTTFWRILGKGQVGITFADSDQIIPSSYRYLLGGENLRGYKFESIGLLDNSGQFSGGRNMALASIETDFRLSQFMGLGLFTDAGQVTNQNTPKSPKVGAGFGLRGFIPIGTAKLDIAWPVSEPDYNRHWRIHLSIGLDL